MSKRLKIWLLVNTKYDGALDVIREAIVIAASPSEACMLLALSAKDEGSAHWLDPERSSVSLVGTAERGAVPSVLITDAKGF